MKFDEKTPHASRFDKVDVLALLDPDWLERSQASRLVQMVKEQTSKQPLRIAEHDRAEMLVA